MVDGFRQVCGSRGEYVTVSAGADDEDTAVDPELERPAADVDELDVGREGVEILSAPARVGCATRSRWKRSSSSGSGQIPVRADDGPRLPRHGE